MCSFVWGAVYSLCLLLVRVCALWLHRCCGLVLGFGLEFVASLTDVLFHRAVFLRVVSNLARACKYTHLYRGRRPVDTGNDEKVPSSSRHVGVSPQLTSGSWSLCFETKVNPPYLAIVFCQASAARAIDVLWQFPSFNSRFRFAPSFQEQPEAKATPKKFELLSFVEIAAPKTGGA